MSILFSNGVHHIDHVDLNTAPITIDGATAVYLRGVECGDITVTDGELYVDDVSAGDIVLEAGANNAVRGSNLDCTGLDLTGGSSGQEVRLDGVRCDGQLISDSTFDVWSITAAVIGGATVPASVSIVDLTDLEDFYLQAHILKSDRHGIRAEDCVVGEIIAQIIDPSQETDNTYDGISLEGVCDRLDIRGAIRGAVNQSNNPQYGIDIASGCLGIDLWLAYSGTQTGDVNDATSGEVTSH